MLDLAIFLKSYAPDAHLVARQIASVEEHNADGVAYLLAVPDDEVSYFSGLSSYAKLTVVPESRLEMPAVTEKVRDFGIGYIEQQIAKLSVHKLGVARNYLVLDSDAYFIRRFTHDDFLDGAGRGFTVLTEDKDQYADPGYARFADVRMAKVNAIADYLELPARPRRTCHNNTVFSSDALHAFDDWRHEAGLSLVDLMNIAPMEFSWYNFYLQRYHPELIVPVDPLFRMVHTRSEFRTLIQQGMTVAALRRSYVGLCINSGWAGRTQDRLVEKLERGSRWARGRVLADRAIYRAHLEYDNLLPPRRPRV